MGEIIGGVGKESRRGGMARRKGGGRGEGGFLWMVLWVFFIDCFFYYNLEHERAIKKK